MVRHICILLLYLSSLPLSAQHPMYDTLRYAPEHYAQRVADFKREPLERGRVTFLGDSQVEFGDWPRLLDTPTLINRGVAGDNTYGILERLDDVIARAPVKLFVVVGINDISQDIPESVILKNILTIVQRVRTGSPGTTVYIHSIFPTNDHVKAEYPDAFGKNSIVQSLNRQVQSAAETHHFTYLDLSAVLSDRQGQLDEQYAEPDGLHLNARGYQAWAQFLKGEKLFR